MFGFLSAFHSVKIFIRRISSPNLFFWAISAVRVCLKSIFRRSLISGPPMLFPSALAWPGPRSWFDPSHGGGILQLRRLLCSDTEYGQTKTPQKFLESMGLYVVVDISGEEDLRV